MKYIQSVIIPLLVAILVGIGSSAVTSAIYIGRMDERLSSLENTQARHKGMFTTLRDRTTTSAVWPNPKRRWTPCRWTCAKSRRT